MASKVFPHAVIYNGVFYPANTPIEVNEVEDEGKQASKPASKRAVKKDDEGTSRKS